MACIRPSLASVAVAAAAVLLSALLVSGCTGDNKPCTTCPPIEGTYALGFEETGAAGCDGGTPPQRDTLALTRHGASLSGHTEVWEDLTGTLYESGDFSLSGTTEDGGTGLDTVSVQGHYRAGIGDGGTPSLDGTWVESHQRSTPSGPQPCTLTRAFSGARQ